MRHGMVNRKLGRTSSHRLAMFRNQLASLIQNERIVTTLPKAKELRPLIEKLITLGKNDNIHSRRVANRMVADDGLMRKLFSTLGPRFAERPGGYTRIIKLGPRRGDAAEMAIIEFVGYELADDKRADTPAAAAPKRASKKKDDQSGAEASTPEEKPKKKAAPKKKATAPKKKTKDEDSGKPVKKTSSKKKSK